MRRYAVIDMQHRLCAWILTLLFTGLVHAGAGGASASNDGSGGARIALGAVTLGTTAKLSLLWNGSVFIFQLDNNTAVTFDPVAAGAPVAQAAPNDPFKAIGTRAFLGTDLGAQGSITASFDNVGTHP